ncbi:MAG: response regulator transcription factor [Deltaproteobacteria bacterium]|nr:MAG: response regulator transcription factor [Deltaproteobacteria bacterium]
MVTDPKVYVVEDDPGVCECLRHLLGSVDIPVETYARAEQFLETQNGGRAGCVVADVCLPGMSGFDLQRTLARRNIRLPIIMITGYGDVPAAVRAMKAGAIDFLEKPFSGQRLLDSITYALKVDGQVRSATAQREQGRTNRSIAGEFGVSEKTVEIHRGQVMSKMQAGNLAELVRIAALLERPED